MLRFLHLVIETAEPLFFIVNLNGYSMDPKGFSFVDTLKHKAATFSR